MDKPRSHQNHDVLTAEARKTLRKPLENSPGTARHIVPEAEQAEGQVRELCVSAVKIPYPLLTLSRVGIINTGQDEVPQG